MVSNSVPCMIDRISRKLKNKKSRNFRFRNFKSSMTNSILKIVKIIDSVILLFQRLRFLEIGEKSKFLFIELRGTILEKKRFDKINSE